MKNPIQSLPGYLRGVIVLGVAFLMTAQAQEPKNGGIIQFYFSAGNSSDNVSVASEPPVSIVGPTPMVQVYGPDGQPIPCLKTPEPIKEAFLEYDKPYQVTITAAAIDPWWEPSGWDWIDLDPSCDGEYLVQVQDPNATGYDAIRGYSSGTLHFVGCTKPSLMEDATAAPVTSLTHNGTEFLWSPTDPEEWALDTPTTLPTQTWTIVLRPANDCECQDPGKADKEQGCPTGCGGGSGRSPVVTAPNEDPSLAPTTTGRPFGTGSNNLGQAAGRIHFGAETEDSSRASRQNLDFRAYLSSDTDAVNDSGGLRQVKSPTNLLDILDITGGFEIRAYTVAANLEPDGNGEYSTTGATLLMTQRVEAVSLNDVPGVKYTTLNATGTVTATEFVYGESDDVRTWRRHELDGVITETETFLLDIDNTDPAHPEWTRTVETVQKKLEGGNEVVVSSNLSTFQRLEDLDEEVLVSEVEDPDGEALTTSYAYHVNPAAPALLGKIDHVTNHYGSWSRTKYSSTGQEIGTLSPWLDGPADPSTATSSNSRFQGSGLDSPPIGDDWIVTSYESALGLGINVNSELARVVQDPWDEEEAIQVFTSTAGGAASEEWFEIDSSSDTQRKRLKRQVNPNGWMVTYLEDGTVIYGRKDSPEGVPYRTTKLVPIAGGGQQTYVYTGGGNYALIASTSYQKDGLGRVTAVLNDGIVVSETIYDTNGDVTEVERDGSEIRTEEGGDLTVQVGVAAGAGWQAQPDVVTEIIEEGDNVRTVVSAGSLSMETISGPNFYTDETGATTTRISSNGGRTTTETRPGNLTVTTEQYLDGQIKSVTGDGVVAQHHSYAIVSDSNGNKVEETIHYGAPTSPRWKKTQRRGDRTVSTASPGPVGNYTETTLYNDAEGRTVNNRTGLAAQIRELVSEEYLIRDGLDISGDGKLTRASTDRIAETEMFYEQGQGGAWYQVTVTRGYQQAGNWTALELERTSRKMGLGPNSEVTIRRADGEVITVTETVNRAAKTLTRTTQTNRSTVPAVELYVNGLLVSRSTHSVALPELYRYDALRRLTEVVDPRTTLAAVHAYNTSGQIASTTDAASNIEEFGYYGPTHPNAGQLHWKENGLGERTYFAYDDAGHLTHQWGPATYPLKYAYNSYGELTNLSTYQADGSGMWEGESPPSAFGTETASVTTWDYDEATGLLTQKLYADNQGPSYMYHNNRLLKTRTWERGTVTTYGYNTAGDLTSVDYSDGTPDVAHTYYRDGQRLTTSDAAGLHTFHAHNPGGLPSGERISSGALSGVNLTYPNDALGRRRALSASLNGQQLMGVTYDYDTVSRLQTVSAGPLAHTYAYVANSDLLHTTTSSHGGQTRLTATRAYDSLGRLDVIANVTSLSQTVSSHDYTYDEAHRRTHALREDGTTWNYAYNDRDEVVGAERVLPGGGAALRGWSRAYGYDAIGNRLSASEGGESGAGAALTQAYTPNALNQYAEISYPSQLAVLGKAETDATVTVNTQSTSRQSNGSFHILLSASNSTGPDWLPVEVEATRTVVPQGNVNTLREGNVFIPPALLEPTYDSDGNLTFDGRWTYSWDGENRLIAQETSSAAATAGVPLQRIEHHYDARSRRFRKVVQSRALANDPWQTQSNELFLYDDYWNPIALIDGATGDAKQLYIWGNDLSGDMHSSGGVGGLLTTIDLTGLESMAWNYAYDGNGNVMAITDTATGDWRGSYGYDAFGKEITATGDWAERSPWRFSTKWNDSESNALYYGYRFFDPNLGRWLSRDPMGESGGINLYTFVSNESQSRTDALGLFECILVTDRPVRNTLGLLFHYGLERWTGCCPKKRHAFYIDKYFSSISTGKIYRPGTFGGELAYGAGIAQKEKVELIKVSGKTSAWKFETTFRLSNLWRKPTGWWHYKIKGVDISVIKYGFRPGRHLQSTRAVSIYDSHDGDVSRKWDQIIKNAQQYRYAEQNDSVPPSNFPWSIYEIDVYANNSNTFVQEMVRNARLRMAYISAGDHPGNVRPNPYRDIYIKWANAEMPHAMPNWAPAWGNQEPAVPVEYPPNVWP